MATVFLVLYFVVTIGNVLIKLANRFSPVRNQDDNEQSALTSIEPKKALVIKRAVEQLTEGKGKVIKIAKVKVEPN